MMNPATPDKKKTWLRFTGLVLGMGILVWLPVEETSELGALVISGLICTWGGVWLLLKPAPDDKHLIMRYVLVGGGAGLLLAPLAMLLLAFKSGIHGHGTPDYTVSQLRDVLCRIPYFVLGGSLVGLGSGLWRFAKRDPSQEE
ncbi:MAG: hypothetical protein MUO57_03880 [Anaerolineales bacterium]|nr:hypothetical protein [Anaerolineales bacterium]